MLTKIHPLIGENKKRVKGILTSHPEIYGKYDDLTVLHAQFYQVDCKNEDFIAFFALAYWENEIVVCCVYVFEKYRRQGVFKKITEFAKRKTSSTQWLTINAMHENAIANSVYERLFEFARHDEDVNWYVIKQRRN